MKATGIIRRVDDLGRVIIPKEIRRALHIKENDTLEIYTDDSGVAFKKYKSDKEEFLEEVYTEFSADIVNVFRKGNNVYVSTRYGRTGEAKCPSKDKFDFNLGVAIALAKIYGVEIPDCI